MFKNYKSCVKFLLYLYIFSYVLSSIALTTIRATSLTTLTGGEFRIDFLEPKFHRSPGLLFYIACFVHFIFLIVLLDCCGAIRENYILIILFSVFLMTVFLNGIIMSYVYRKDLEYVAINKKDMLKSIKRNNQGTKKLWDHMQVEWKCCGVFNASDYDARAEPKIPKSCCEINVRNDRCFESDAYKVGCHDRLVSMLKSKFVLIGTAGLVVTVVQIVGLSFTWRFAIVTRKKLEVF